MGKYEEDGMRFPAIDQLTDKTDSKYKLVVAAAVRAKQIEKGDFPRIAKPVNKKSIGIALEEIYENKVEIR